MTLATEVQKLKDSKAYFAVAGAGDLAREKLREVPDRLRDLRAENDPKDFPGAALSYASQAGAKASELIDGLAERGRTVVGKPEAEQDAPEIEAVPATPPKSE